VTVGSANLKYGAFLQAILNFLIIAFVIFCMVKAINVARTKTEKALLKKAKEAKAEAEKAEAAQPDPQIVLLQEIRDLLQKEQNQKA
ncbi:MAG: MscL family protein, partial [Allobaculum sp.]|nr:MscL family protein [Allobaculum sp.]